MLTVKALCLTSGNRFTLKGFEPGQNWVQITLIDEQGNPIDNVFNSTVRLINYDPEQRDTPSEVSAWRAAFRRGRKNCKS